MYTKLGRSEQELHIHYEQFLLFSEAAVRSAPGGIQPAIDWYMNLLLELAKS